MKIQPGRNLGSWALAALSVCLVPFAHGQEPAVEPARPAADTVVLPQSVPDPLEPLNRMVWAFNQRLMSGVVRPTSRVYRFVVAKPVRTGIGNFGHNLTYPGRVINHLLQGKWTGARDESYRFAWNTTLGIGGFFDVASKRNLPRSEADFGQTFGQWGWQPNCFLMLPILGASNERDTLGWAADTAANPLLYIAPYRFVGDNPLTYLGPYTYFSYVVTYNDLSDRVGEYVRFNQAEMDSYAQIQYAWAFARESRMADFQLQGEQDAASLETLESVFFTFKDPKFLNRGQTRSVLIPATGKQLKFTFWLQPGKAPVVYLMPGLGSHRLGQTSLALAELVYQNGFSAVCVSSAFHAEFMEHAATADLPAYLPAEGHDLHVALTEIDRRLNVLYPNRWGDKALMGYSMGGLHSLFIAATASTNQLPLMKFDRYVAISAPVRVLHAAAKLDEFYHAPLEWPEAERTGNIEKTFWKVAALSKSSVASETSLPFNAIESKFLIGLMFRFVLRDIIFNSQRRNNQGVLHQPLRHFRRAPVYQEILQYSYADYFEKFAVPYYQARGVALPGAEALGETGDLRTYEDGLRASRNVRVIVNQNDFLLSEEDLAWLRATFAPEDLTVFEQGGHLGNLARPAVQRSILDALGDLNASR